MTSDADLRRPWPRFTQRPAPPPPREGGPHEPWPRWGWFPHEQRTWTFAPAPNLTAPALGAPATPAAKPHPVPPATPEPPLPSSLPEDHAPRATERDDEPAHPTLPPAREEREVLEPELLPVRRSPSLALVPVRTGEVTLSDVARAVRKVAPAAAVVGAAVAAGVALFRRR